MFKTLTAEDRHKKPFSICKTKTGWLGWWKKAGESQLVEEAGVGVNLYFKTMKQMIIFFFLCSFLTFPMFVFNVNFSDNS
jgi:hypothetical protein